MQDAKKQNDHHYLAVSRKRMIEVIGEVDDISYLRSLDLLEVDGLRATLTKLSISMLSEYDKYSLEMKH